MNDEFPASPPAHPATNEYVAVSPASTSAVLSAPMIVFTVLFSEMVLAERVMSWGTSFTSVTAIANDLS